MFRRVVFRRGWSVHLWTDTPLFDPYPFALNQDTSAAFGYGVCNFGPQPPRHRTSNITSVGLAPRNPARFQAVPASYLPFIDLGSFRIFWYVCGSPRRCLASTACVMKSAPCGSRALRLQPSRFLIAFDSYVRCGDVLCADLLNWRCSALGPTLSATSSRSTRVFWMIRTSI